MKIIKATGLVLVRIIADTALKGSITALSPEVALDQIKQGTVVLADVPAGVETVDYSVEEAEEDASSAPPVERPRGKRSQTA